MTKAKAKKAAVKKIEKAAEPVEVEKVVPIEPEPVEIGELLDMPRKLGGIGIIKSIVEAIQKKALSKSEILEILVEKFPDRPAAGMKSTISIQLGPTRLATKYKLVKDGDKYRIEA